MTYLIAEIAVCLILAAAIGFLIGWLVSRAAGRTRLEAVENSWAARFAGREREREESRQQSEETAKRLAAEQQTGREAKSRLDAAQAAIDTHSRRISELLADLEKWRLRAAEFEKVAEERSVAVNGLRSENDDLKARIAALNSDLQTQQAGFRRSADESEKRRQQFEAQWAERLKDIERSRDEHRRQAEEAAARHLSEQGSHQAARQRIEELTAGLNDRDQRISAFSAEIEDHRRKTAALQKSIDERTAQFATQQQEAGALKDRIAALHADLGNREQHVRGLEAELDSLRQKIWQLEAEVSRRDERLAAAAQTLSTCEIDLSSLSKTSTERTQELSGVLNQLRERVSELAPAVQSREAEIARLLGQIAEWEKRYADLDRRMQSCETDLTSRQKAPANLLTSRPDQVDDLKEVRGIGPVLERVLNRLGIYLFRQIAAFTPADVAWVASNLPEFPGRIIWERWIDQAQDLHIRKYGAKP